MNLLRDQVRAYVDIHRDTLVRLLRVKAALKKCDEHEAAAVISTELRPLLRTPSMSEADLRVQQQVLEQRLRKLEDGWERRN